MSAFINADSSKSLYKLYHKSHFVLAGLVPATLALPSDGVPAKLTDVGIATVLPLHSHISLNAGKARGTGGWLLLYSSFNFWRRDSLVGLLVRHPPPPRGCG